MFDKGHDGEDFTYAWVWLYVQVRILNVRYCAHNLGLLCRVIRRLNYDLLGWSGNSEHIA
jgi:hypothetical protein